MEDSIIEAKKDLLKEAKKLIPKREIEYYSIWVKYNGKKLRILAGAKLLSEKEVFISFTFQSPKEQKDLLGRAIRNVKRRLNGHFFIIRKDKLIDNLFVLAKAFCILHKEVYWMDDIWNFDYVEKHPFKSTFR